MKQYFHYIPRREKQKTITTIAIQIKYSKYVSKETLYACDSINNCLIAPQLCIVSFQAICLFKVFGVDVGHLINNSERVMIENESNFFSIYFLSIVDKKDKNH